MAKVDYFIKTYDYFSNLNDGPFEGTLLDYGSNYGLFLDSSGNKFDAKNYTGIDVDIEALNHGKDLFPDATFIHYNKHNYMYNPNGKKDIWPGLDSEFNNIISYSVITHTTVEDFLSTVEWLYSKLKPNGKLFITYLDITNSTAKRLFYNKRVRMFGSCDEIVTDDFIYLVDNKVSKTAGDGMLLTFYTEEYLTKILSNYNFTLYKNLDKISDCFQDCVIITK